MDAGVDRIAGAFARAEAEDRAALMPYLPLGYPTPAASLDLVEAAVAGGADVVELGVPFSDPLADGPTIQGATQVALSQGMSLARCLSAVRTLRARGVTTPFVLMGYYNPVLAYGEDALCRDARAAGVDGLIVPDLPPEEGAPLEARCDAEGLGLIYLLAPTSPEARVRRVVAQARGFVYLVAVTGITGARDRLAPGLAAFVQRVRAATDKPLAVGFGISTPAQARRVAALADGVIVGSALVRAAAMRAAEGDAPARVRAFVAGLREGVAS